MREPGYARFQSARFIIPDIESISEMMELTSLGTHASSVRDS